MPRWVSETSLPMNSPRRFVIRGRLYRGCARCASAIDEAIWFMDKDLDPRGGQINVGRALLCLAARHGLVNEERGAVDMKSGNSAEIPKLGRAERRLVPSDRCSGVGNDQHHRNKRPVAFASHQSRSSDTLSAAPPFTYGRTLGIAIRARYGLGVTRGVSCVPRGPRTSLPTSMA
jgi:hypothetical protein